MPPNQRIAMPSHTRTRLVATFATAALAGSLALVPVTGASAALVSAPPTLSADDAAIALSPLGTFETGVYDASAAEIVQPHGDRLFVVNAQAGAVDVLRYADPTAITKLFSLTSEGVANSVAIRADGLGVAAFEAPVKTDPGHLVFFDAEAADASTAVLGTVTVGALPDMVTFSADGRTVVVANEGEPADDFSVDPEGSISVISAPETTTAPTQSDVRTADFHAFEGGALPAGVRVFGPRPHGDDLPVSRNLEPEYVTVAGGTAYVSLQEANAIAAVDLASATVTAIHPLGAKDHGLAANALDPSDKDGKSALRTYPGLKGLYQPDGIASYTADGATYLVTANEGDAREWGDYKEGARVKDLGKKKLAPVCTDSPLAGSLGDADLGRLNVTTEEGLDADAGCYRELFAFGGRSFSIWSTDGALVWDSGSDFEEITLAAEPEHFNANHTSSDADGRSDDKGPEPESVVVGQVGGRTYAFVGFERVGGIAAYDITDPQAPAFVTYLNNRDFAQSGETNLSGAGDLGPEGLAFIGADRSPTGSPLLAVGNEVSGTTTVFSIDELGAPKTTDITLLGINDFHGRIDANTVAFAGTVEQQRAAATGPVLFLSSGDNIGASLFASSVAKDQPTIDVLNTLGLQATAVGNHEFDRGFTDLAGRVTDAADYPQLGANVYQKGTTTPALPEYQLLDADGLTVGIIGAVTEETASAVSPAGISTLDFGDPVEAVNRVAAQLSDGDPSNGEADVLVALYHEGAGAGTPDGATLDQEIAAGGAFAQIVTDTSADVDAIFTGHTHKTYAWSAPIPGTDRTRPVVQTGSYGANLGKITLSVDGSGTVTAHTETNVPRTKTPAADLIATYPRVAAVNDIVTQALAAAAEVGNTRVATISGDLTTAFSGGSFVDGVWTGGKRDDRGSESVLGNLVAESIRSSLSNLPNGAQIGVTNPGGLRAELWSTQAAFEGSAVAGLKDGEISFSQATAVLPFNNTMALVTLTGAQFTQLLEQQWQATLDGSAPKSKYLQLGLSDNVTYTFDATRAAGSRITSVTVDGAPLDPTASYRIGTLSFLAQGGDNFHAFTQGTGFVDTGLLDYEAWIDYLADQSPVQPRFAKHAVGVSGAPAEAAAGSTVSFAVSGLDLTSRGTPQTTSLTARLGGIELGTVPVENGSATVSVTIPEDAAAGASAITLTAEAGTVVTVPLTVTAAQPGTPWATIDVGAGTVAQGGTLPVRVSGLEPGDRISATLRSDPIVVTGIPAAGADGTVAFDVAIPADFAVGAHTLTIEKAGAAPLSAAVTVTARAGSGTGTGTGSGAGSGSDAAALATSGGTFPIGFATVLVLGLLAAGVVLTLRHRQRVS